jgi:hypothetical protein
LTQRSFLFPILVIVVIAAAYTAIRFKRAGLTDFVVPRTAAARFVAREPLYRPEDGHYQFKYLPAFALVMAPLAWMSKEAAEVAWFALSILMAWAFVRRTIGALPERRLPFAPLVWWTLLLNAKFLLKELGFGQVDLPLALLYWGAILSDDRDRRGLAGTFIAAGAFIKPYTLVLLPWLVWTRRRRSPFTFAVVLAAGLAVPAVTYGWDGNLALLHDWYRTVTGTTGPNLASRENVSFAALWARWLPPGAERSALALVSVALTMAAGLAVMWQRQRVHKPEYLEGAYFAALVPLVSPQGWDYLLLLALPGYACLVDRWRDTSTLWRAVTLTGFLLTSFATYELMRRTVYFHLMEWGAGTMGAALIAASLFHLRWRGAA